MNMSYSSRQEYLNVQRSRYAKASSRQEKSRIIDEAVSTLGYHRKHVTRELNRSFAKREIRSSLYTTILSPLRENLKDLLVGLICHFGCYFCPLMKLLSDFLLSCLCFEVVS